MNIPVELLQDPGGPLIILLLFLALVGALRLWQKAEDACKLIQQARSDEGAVAAKAISEQSILNVGSIHRIELVEYQRDEALRREARCEKELDLLRATPRHST